MKNAVRKSLERLYYYGECDELATKYLASQGIMVYPDEDGIIREYDKFEQPYTSAAAVEEEIRRTDVDINDIWEDEEEEKEAFFADLEKIKEKFLTIEEIAREYLRYN